MDPAERVVADIPWLPMGPPTAIHRLEVEPTVVRRMDTVNLFHKSGL